MRRIGSVLLDLLQKPPKYKSYPQLCRDLNISKRLPIFQKTLPAFQNQRHIRKVRMSTPRNPTSKVTYAAFLRKLYPLGPYVNHEDLYNSYCSLPFPQPLHIEAQHFEHLLCQFINSGGFYRGENSTHLINLISDMLDCDMRASTKEINTYLYLRNYNNEKNLENVEKDYESVANMQGFDISTVNIFLKFGLQMKNFGFVTKVLSDMTEKGLKFDRMTYQMLINYSGKVGNSEEVNSLFQEFLGQGLVLDISIVNAIINALVKSDELDVANEIVGVLFQKANEINTSLSKSHGRRQNVQELNYIDSLKIQEIDSLLFVPTPTFNTFSPLLNTYSSLTHFEPLKIFKYLEELNDLNIEIPNSMYVQIFRAFQQQDVRDLDYLKFMLNFLINEKNIKYNKELFDSIIESFLKHSGYNNKLVNGIEKQWLSLKKNMNGGTYKEARLEFQEFTTDAINKLLMFY